MEYQLKVITENDVNRYTLCDNNDNFYTINRLLYDILYAYKENNSYAYVCQKMNGLKTENFFTEAFIEDSVNKAMAIVHKKDAVQNEESKYIKFKFSLIKEGGAVFLYRILSILFNRSLFNILFPASIILSILFFFKNGFANINLLQTKIYNSLSLQNSIGCYLVFLVIIFIHELGHASATFNFKVKPKEIGAGLYFIFPVLYTNVTQIWTLKLKERIIVNLGGIYFQLLINVVLMLLMYAHVIYNVAFILFLANSSTILVSFNPFFRYDGYWIYSDLFKITNLRDKSSKFLSCLISSPRHIKRYIASAQVSYPTIIYSICNAIFWLWVYISIAKYLIKNIPQLISSINTGQHLGIGSVPIIATSLFIFIWFFNFIISFILKLSKSYNYVK